MIAEDKLDIEIFVDRVIYNNYIYKAPIELLDLVKSEITLAV